MTACGGAFLPVACLLMDNITEHELLVSRGLRSRVFSRARVLFPVVYPEVAIDRMELDSFDYIPGVAGLEGKIYITFQEGADRGPHAFPAKLFIGLSDQEALAQAGRSPSPPYDKVPA